MRFVRTMANGVLVASLLALVLVYAAQDQARAQGGLFDDMMQDGPRDWRGLYVGGQVGYAWGHATFVVPAVGRITDIEPEGVLGGGHVGYNWQVRDAVFGVVGDFNIADVNDRAQSPLAAVTNRVDMDVNGSVRGKFGIALDRFVIYATAGVAIAHIENDDFHVAFGRSVWDRVHFGLTGGGGIQVAFNDWISGFVEYRYTVYGDETFGPQILAIPHSANLGYSQVQAGLSFQLGDWWSVR